MQASLPYTSWGLQVGPVGPGFDPLMTSEYNHRITGIRIWDAVYHLSCKAAEDHNVCHIHIASVEWGREEENLKDGVKIIFLRPPSHDSSSNPFSASLSLEIQVSYRVFLLPDDTLIAHVIAQRHSNSGIHSAHWVFVYSTHRRLGIARGLLSAAARSFIHGCSSSLSQAGSGQAMMVLMDARGKGGIVDTEFVSTMFKWLSYGPNKGRYISKVYKSSFGLVIQKKWRYWCCKGGGW